MQRSTWVYSDSRGPGSGTRIAWSRNGAYVGFIERGADRRHVRLVRTRADGSGAVEPVTPFTLAYNMNMGYWSLDDATIVAGASYGLTEFTPGRDTAWVRLLDVGQAYESPTISPDQRWVAYVARVDRQQRIFVRPFPNVEDSRTPVSDGQGFAPRWSPDGRSLFYTRFNDTGMELVEVSVQTGAAFSVASRRALFSFQTANTVIVENWGWLCDVDPTGKRFVASRRRVDLPRVDGVWQVTNLFTELREKVGAR